jgi:hypothetical protein
MPSLLLHASAIEALSASRSLPAPLGRALVEDLPYARFGALLPDLPWCGGLQGGLVSTFRDRDVPFFAREFHERAPVAMGLKMAELVDSGALVGREAGLAVVCGYFTHLCLDRALHPLVDRLVGEHRLRGETRRQAHRRIEWAQGVFYLRDLHGRDLLGTGAIRERFQLSKSRLPVHGIGKGLYELVRLAAQAELGAVPDKREVDAWVRGAFLHGLVLSTLVGRARGTNQYPALTFRELYRGEDIDFFSEVEKALGQAREVLERVHHLIERGSFTRRSRERFMEAFPEGGVAAFAA